MSKKEMLKQLIEFTFGDFEDISLDKYVIEIKRDGRWQTLTNGFNEQMHDESDVVETFLEEYKRPTTLDTQADEELADMFAIADELRK